MSEHIAAPMGKLFWVRFTRGYAEIVPEKDSQPRPEWSNLLTLAEALSAARLLAGWNLTGELERRRARYR